MLADFYQTDLVRKKIKKAKTDNLGDIQNDPDLKSVRPEVRASMLVRFV